MIKRLFEQRAGQISGKCCLKNTPDFSPVKRLGTLDNHLADNDGGHNPGATPLTSANNIFYRIFQSYQRFMFLFRLYLLHYIALYEGRGPPAFRVPCHPPGALRFGNTLQGLTASGPRGGKPRPINPSSGTSRLLTENIVKATAFALERWPSG